MKKEWGHLEAEVLEGIDTMPASQQRKKVIAERLNETGFYSKSAVQAMGSAAEFINRLAFAVGIYRWAAGASEHHKPPSACTQRRHTYIPTEIALGIQRLAHGQTRRARRCSEHT